MKQLDFVIFDAGGGHRSAATAVQEVARQQERSWQVRLLNLQEALDPIDPVRKLAKFRIQDCYNLMLRNGWTLGATRLLPLLHFAIRTYHRQTVRMLEQSWKSRMPDMVVSFVPHFNRALAESLERALPGRPFVTVLTDLADYPPHFWIERQEQFVICGTRRAVDQARALGHFDGTVFRTSGMILNPRFYSPVSGDRTAERQRLGLRPDLPTGLVLFGGQGSRVMREIAERLEQSELDLQLIMICGRNEALAERLRQRHWRFPMFVEGFTREVPYYMHLADFFIGKPGPGSISEALAMKLPVIVELNSWTLPQERYNTEWVGEMQLGLVVKNFRSIAGAVEQLLKPESFARFRSNVQALKNRAVYEIPDILQQIFERRQVRQPSKPSGDQPTP